MLDEGDRGCGGRDEGGGARAERWWRFCSGSEWCAMCVMGSGGHALHTVVHTVLQAVMYIIPYAALRAVSAEG